MKLALLFSLATLLTCPAFAQSVTATNAPPAIPPPRTATPPMAPPGGRGSFLSPEEVQALNKARSEALQANPDLETERKELDEKGKAWQMKLEADMAKVDPSVAPILARIQAMRAARDAGGPQPPAPMPTPRAQSPAPSTNSPAGNPPSRPSAMIVWQKSTRTV